MQAILKSGLQTLVRTQSTEINSGLDLPQSSEQLKHTFNVSKMLLHWGLHSLQLKHILTAESNWELSTLQDSTVKWFSRLNPTSVHDWNVVWAWKEPGVNDLLHNSPGPVKSDVALGLIHSGFYIYPFGNVRGYQINKWSNPVDEQGVNIENPTVFMEVGEKRLKMLHTSEEVVLPAVGMAKPWFSFWELS